MARDGDGVPLLQARSLAEARYLVGRVAPWEGLGRLGFASIALDWERPFLGPLHAWSVQGKSGPLTLPTMIRVLCGWLAERLENTGRLQKPEPLLEGAAPLSFFTDAKAEDGRAWIGGFFELVDGCQGTWFSLEVTPEWAPCAFAKGDPGKVIAALELLATLVGVRLWVPEGNAKKTSRVAIRGYTDNQSNEGEALEWRVLGRLLAHATSYFEELGSAKRTKKAPATRFAKRPRKLGLW